MPCENHPETEEGLDACYGCGLPFCPNCLVVLFELKYCSACKGEAVKDMHSGVERAGSLPLASIGARLAAFLLDFVLFLIVVLPLAFVMGVMKFEIQTPEELESTLGQQLAMNLALTAFQVALLLIYHSAMVQWKGQTLGKMALGIKVVTASGKDVTPKEAWIRGLINCLLFIICCYGLLDNIFACFTNERTAIHDMAAKTRVVKL